MMNRLLFRSLALVLVLGLAAHADTIIVKGRDKPLEGTVKSEDAKNVVVTPLKKKVDETIPSVDIVDIVYENVSPIALTIKGGAYRLAKDAEKEADTEDAAKRKTSLTVALVNYTKTLKEMKRDTQAQKYAARHLEFKVAVLSLNLATDTTSTDRAVAKLQAFKTSFPSSWQINQVMPMIAQLQMDSKDWAEAAKTFQEMSEMEVFSPAVRRDAELMVVTVAVRAKDIDLANKRLDVLAKKAGKDPLFVSRVNMARSEVLIAVNKFKEAIPLLQGVINDNNDKQTKALAHNALGECYYKAERYNEALWEFLWVDTVFNQDRNQHAKALFYLWKTFQKLPNNEERAQECRDTLISDRQFAGTEYQREALKAK
jgi:tetratricopeptide (TPR) repeat protein